VPDLLRPLVIDSGGTDNGMDVLVHAEADVLHHHVRVGEVDHHLAAGIGQGEQPLPATDGCHQVHVVRGINHLTDLGTHPTAGTDHSDPQNLIRHGDAASLYSHRRQSLQRCSVWTRPPPTCP